MKPTYIEHTKTEYSQKYALYLCECGNEFESRIHNVKSGNTSSCGCKHVSIANKKRASARDNYSVLAWTKLLVKDLVNTTADVKTIANQFLTGKML